MPIQERSNISRVYRDININFKRNPVTNDLVILKNEDAIKKSVFNLVRTVINERFFNPLIGTSVESLLFELNSNNLKLETVLRGEIQSAIRNFEPRVSFNDLIIDVDADNNSLSIELKYDIVGENLPPQTATFLLTPTRI